MSQWLRAVPEGGELSLYVHIPFCRRLCWFCACRTQGTKTDAPLGRYVAHLLQEARNQRASLPHSIRPTRLHLGGGTPTILPPALLEELLSGLQEIYGFAHLSEFSVEVDPTDVDLPRLEILRRFGMNRASLGIQDFEPQVQEAIGRAQSFERTRDVVAQLRGLGINSINFDLLYGLPHQTTASLRATLDAALSLHPGRIALFGYAHVPWMSKRQVMIPADALPAPETRYHLFQTARKHLLGSGFLQIGIDHFALPQDGLAQAFLARRLRRSFQGYTDDQTPHLLALGASAISTYPEGFAQNIPVTGQYAKALEAGHSPVARGYALSPADKIKARVVEDLLCYHRADIKGLNTSLAPVLQRYAEALRCDGTTLSLANWAQPLVRIIAAEIALGVPETNSAQRYSQAI